MSLRTLREHLGPVAHLATIAPPGKSYAEWDRFLDECREAGVAALDPVTQQFYGPMGFALLRRWRWLKDSRDRGIPYAQAEQAFVAALERESKALKESMAHTERTRQRAMAERDGKKGKRRAQDGYQDDDDHLLDYAVERGL